MSTEPTERRALDRDETDQQSALVAPLLPPAVGGGGKRSADPLEVLNLFISGYAAGYRDCFQNTLTLAEATRHGWLRVLVLLALF